ncbi:hypothetical protein MNBD_DELTA03-1468, partial [hydrothermal vent metagenome]
MLSITISLVLRPWFTNKTLEAADKLLKDVDCRVICYRSAVAAIFNGMAGYCLLDFRAAPKISQGFRIIDERCSICGHRQRNGDHCRHLAALTIKMMLNAEDGPFPAPLLFPHSPLTNLGAFLHQKAARPHISTPHDDQIIFANDNFTVGLAGLRQALEILPPIFSQYNFPISLAANFDQQALTDAWEHLRFLCRSETEEKLNSAGQDSRGQTQDSGIWVQICRLFFTRQGAENIQPILQRQIDNKSKANNGFSLVFSTNNGPQLQITPSRHQLINLLKQTGSMELINVKGKARAYSKIYFQDDDSLMIEPWLDLGDSGCQRRLDIEDSIFDGYYAARDNNFYEIEEQEDDFTPASGHSALPLLAFAERTNPAAPIIIPSGEVPAFLDKHLRAILSGRHDPDPALSDFSIDDLPDTIEVLDYNEDDDWCYLSARYTCGSRHLDLREIMALRKNGEKHATGRDKWLNLQNTPLDWFYDLGDERLQKGTKGDEKSLLRLSKLEMMSLLSLVPELNLPQDNQGDLIKSRLRQLRHADLADADIPRHLRDYQRSGLAWLNHLYVNGIGGILADDMGLGKTHQALALLQLALRMGSGPALVICPASVLSHWQDKLDKFYPEVKYQIHYGPKRRLGDLAASHVLLTTYGVMRQDIDLLKRINFGVLIFDEIQYLKNRDNATSKAATLLNSRVCFGLSGTPVENSLTDLKAIYDICLPGLLGSHSNFRRTYVIPIEEQHDDRRLAALQRLTQPFMLRRSR